MNSNLLMNFLYPALVILLTLGAGYVVRQILIKFISKWTEKTATKIDDIIIEAIKKPVLIWAVLVGISFAMRTTPLSKDIITLLDRLLLIFWVLSLAFVISKILAGFIQEYSKKIDSALAVTSLSRNVSSLLVFGLAFLIILNQLGIAITPILTALGVGGLAVALAFQDTLSNLFSGIHTIISKQVRLGDYVVLESGQEGYVTDIGWRSTKIRMLTNSIIIVPNAKLAGAIVTNHYMPNKEVAVTVEVGVAYDSDLEKVEKVTVETARSVMKEVSGGVSDFEPLVRYHTFADSSINFTVVLRAKEFTDKFLITHEFVKRLKKRYEKEGIEIPFPIRTIVNK
ncbi:MAG: mechanosensitive ion channel family protein [Elusimicrobiota bacterium]